MNQCVTAGCEGRKGSIRLYYYDRGVKDCKEYFNSKVNPIKNSEGDSKGPLKTHANAVERNVNVLINVQQRLTSTKSHRKQQKTCEVMIISY